MSRVPSSRPGGKPFRGGRLVGKCLALGLAVTLLTSVCHAQSGPDLQYHVKYRCGGETIVVAYCRHDSDMAGYPPTTSQNDYCLVYHPDRPMRGGFVVQTSELRSAIIRQLQACGALSGPSGSPARQTPASSQTAEEYMKEAEPYFNTKNADKAIAPLQKAIALSPSAIAYNDLGVAYANLGQFADSAAALEQAVKLDPNDANMRGNLGFAYLRLKKYDQAAAQLREALRLKPDFPEDANLLGIALDDSKHYPEAIAAYKQAIQLNPRFTDAYSNLGDLYVEIGEKDDALEVYREIQELSQDDADNLYKEIIQADVESTNKPSATERAKAYSQLGVSDLLAKANRGDDAAMKRLSDLYFERHDNADGLKWEIKAAQKGDPEIQDDLGVRYEEGSGTPRGIFEARKWYRKAGEQGYDTAQLHLCLSYAAELGLDDGVLTDTAKDNLNGATPPVRGPKADIDEAFKWCVRGGDQGMYRAAWYAGVLNARGGGTHSPDYAEAYFWLSNASLRAGNAFRQSVGRHLTDSQRAEIEKRAALFHPPPLEFIHDQMLKHPSQQ